MTEQEAKTSMDTATTKGPKLRGTPGQFAKELEGGVNAALDAPKSARPETVVTKDLTKTPAGTVREPVVERETEAEALELANKRNRAVFTPNGYVCPSIIRERR